MIEKEEGFVNTNMSWYHDNRTHPTSVTLALPAIFEIFVVLDFKEKTPVKILKFINNFFSLI